jgi:hypothetical protein
MQKNKGGMKVKEKKIQRRLLMKKHVLPMLLVLVMAVFFLPSTVHATETGGDASETVTRIQWLKELTQTFEFSVEENNYPDNYYGDISSDYADYYTVMLATEFGVLDIEAGENVYPDEPATREFTAQTLNFCLGFQLEDNSTYTFSDSADTAYPEDAQVALNRGWFQLIDGKFSPDTAITSTEKTSMLADAQAVLASAVVDENHDNTYQFADFVTVVPQTVPVSIDENDTVTLTDTSVSIAQGDTFVVWPSEMPSIYVAETVTNTDGTLVITTSEADTSAAVLSVDSSGICNMDLSQFEEAADVSVTYVRTQKQARSAAQLYGISASQNSVIATKDIKLSNGAKVSITCNLSNLSLSHNIDTSKRSFYAAVKGTSTITGTASLDAVSAALGSSTVTLGSVRVAGVGKVTVSVELALNGKITATYTGNFEAGMQHSKNDGFRLVKSFQKRSFTTTAEANASIGIKVSVGLDLVVLSGNIYAKTGISAKITSHNYNDGKKPNNCTQISAWLYVSIGAEAKVNLAVWSKTWNKSLDIYNSGNSPVRLSFHYEDGRQVYSCSRESSGSTGSTKYVTPSDSVYGTSSYGDISSTGTDSAGNEMTVWTYTVNDDNATITGYNGNAGIVSVPSNLDGHPVTAIGDSAFANNKKVVRVIVPEGVTSIGIYAFSGCVTLENLTLPDSLTSMGELMIENTAISSITIPKNVSNCGGYDYNGPLANCKPLTSVVFAEGMTSIPAYICASRNYTSYVSSVTIPSSATRIGHYAFYNCSRLVMDTIPEGISTIGERSFYGCASIDRMTLPATVSAIGASAFASCTGMESVTILSNSKVGFSVEIGSSAFSDCTSLLAISLSGNVNTLGNYAFSGCTALESFSLPEGVTSIGDYAFSGCTALESLVLPDSLTSMGYRMIENTAIPNITIPRNVTDCSSSGYNGPLANCKTLTSVVFAEGMTSMPSYVCASGDYTSYVSSVAIPSSVTNIGDYAFYNCTNLATINYMGTTAEDWNKITIGSNNSPVTADLVSYHTHTYTVQETVAPTCTTEGYTLYTCSGCGSSYQGDKAAALGHTEVIDAARAATCTETGLTEGKHCSVCETVLEPQQTIPATGHSYTERITQRATCETDGTSVHTCSACNDSYTSTIPATGHDYSIAVEKTPATCTEEGVKTLYCANCGNTREEAIPTIDHTYVETVVPPTCTEIGYTKHVCSMCSDSYNTNITAPTGHTWDDGVITTEATATTTGVKTYTCTSCGTTRTETIPVLTDTRTAQTITGTATYLKTYGDGSFLLDVEITEGDGILSYASSNAQVVTVSSAGLIVIHGVGTADITVCASETDTYLETTFVISVTVTKATQVIEGTSSYEKKVSDEAFTLDAALADGAGSLSYASSNEEVATVSDSGLVTLKGVGTAVITVTASETGNYTACSFEITLTVTEDSGQGGEPDEKKSQTITGTDSYTKTFGDKGFNLDAVLIEGDGDLTYVSSNTDVVTVSSSGRVVIKGAGTANISVLASATDSYLETEFVVSITVEQASQAIEGITSYSKKVSDRAFILDVELTEGDGAISYDSSNEEVVTVSDAGLVTLKGVGTAVITVTASETGNYMACSLEITLTVTKDSSGESEKPGGQDTPNPPVSSDNPDDEKGGTTMTPPSGNETPISAPNAGTVLKDSSGDSYKIIEKGTSVEYCQPASASAAAVKIPDTVQIGGLTYEVTAIAAKSFKNAKDLTQVTVSKNVNTIGKEAFGNCTKLKTLIFAAGSKINTISDNAFSGCSSLKKITIPATVTSIGTKAFYKNNSLTKITIPSTVKRIGKQAFYGCKKLKKITVKTSKLTAKTVGSKAFGDIHKKASVKVPAKKLKSYKKLFKKKGLSGKRQKVK